VQVGAGQVVKVYVSLGKVQVVIPDLSGLSVEKAKTTLEGDKLVLGETTKQDSPSIKKDVVIGTTPESGEPASQGDTIDLIVSTGEVNVPNVVNSSASDAGGKLSSLQLNVTVISDTGCSGGMVTHQSLSPGHHSQKSKITITVCTG
jgi:serine/threonine-protein kinase